MLISYYAARVLIPMSDVYVAHVLNAVVMCWPMSIVDPGAFRTFPQSFRSLSVILEVPTHAD